MTVVRPKLRYKRLQNIETIANNDSHPGRGGEQRKCSGARAAARPIFGEDHAIDSLVTLSSAVNTNKVSRLFVNDQGMGPVDSQVVVVVLSESGLREWPRRPPRPRPAPPNSFLVFRTVSEKRDALRNLISDRFVRRYHCPVTSYREPSGILNVSKTIK
ncbi:hypothetical protein EVAR_37556_1 [Eumeta japonica]|uniref:Uncharacterized protein n=1 Tax=Eumeta variegata TaxID=151549 RepID=A0A4C1XU46_EUMVA|nr:hypothetical protein EVAR_37556_1 [Eumeta japonica]